MGTIHFNLVKIFFKESNIINIFLILFLEMSIWTYGCANIGIITYITKQKTLVDPTTRGKN